MITLEYGPYFTFLIRNDLVTPLEGVMYPSEAWCVLRHVRLPSERECGRRSEFPP